MKTYKKGISLIVLVITVIVLAILATTVIISLSNTNIITQTTETTFKANIAGYKEALNLYLASELAGNYNFKFSSLNVSYEDDEDTFVEIFGDVPENYRSKLKVANGGLVYETENLEEIEILSSMDVAISVASPEEWFTNCTYTYVDEYGSYNYENEPCFDIATGTLYSMNLPDGVKTVSIPSEINGVKVKAISGFVPMPGDSDTLMPETLKKVFLPKNITLSDGAFTTAEPIEVIAAGPVKFDSFSNGYGPVITLSENSKIKVADGSVIWPTALDRVPAGTLDFTGCFYHFDGGIVGPPTEDFIAHFKMSDGIIRFPGNPSNIFSVMYGVNFVYQNGDAYEDPLYFEFSQVQFNEVKDVLDKLTLLEDGSYQLSVNTGPEVWTEVDVYILVK